MRAFHLVAALVCAGPALAQNWYIPPAPTLFSGCNVIPFGQFANGPFYNTRYQTRVTAADLGNTLNLITGLAFAPCVGGRAHYDNLEIVMDHIPANQPLSNTFASNLTPAAVTVLSSSNYTWNVTASGSWSEVGLQTLFVYNGVDDLVIQITSTNGTAPINGMRSEDRTRLWWIGTSGPPAASGYFDNAALAMEVSMLMGKMSSHGDGCPGSYGTPTLTLSGSPVVGNTVSFGLTSGVPSSIGLFFAGLSNAAPFPFDLSILGMPGCYAYTDLTATAPVLLDPTGSGSFALPIPAAAIGFLFYGQYAVLDPTANAFGFTTSNYGRVLTGY